MIRKDDILRTTDKGIHVFRHYLGKDFKVGKNFLNPFYRDTKASCNIYYDRKAGVFKMKDFGNEEYSGDCFELVGRLNGLDCRNPKDFVEIMQIIDRDLYLGLSKDDNWKENRPMGTNSENDAPTDVPVERRKRPYATVQKPFSTLELAFWGKSGIRENTLKQYRVVSLKKFSSENADGKPYALIATEQEPMFGYLGRNMSRYIVLIRKYVSCMVAIWEKITVSVWNNFRPKATCCLLPEGRKM